MLRCYKMENSLFICIGTIIGTMIGSIISFLTTLFINHSKNKREDNLYLRKKREQLYLETLDILSLMQDKIEPHIDQEVAKNTALEVKNEFSKLNSRFILYASEEVKIAFAEFRPIAGIIYNLLVLEEGSRLRYEQYSKLVFPEKKENLIKMMKEEIGTAEKQKSKGFQCNLCSWIQSKFSAK